MDEDRRDRARHHGSGGHPRGPRALPGDRRGAPGGSEQRGPTVMSAPARVSIDQLKEALQQTRGNIEHAAALAGMSPNNLRKRLAVAGIDVNTLPGDA